MPSAPKSLASIINNSGSTAALVAQTRRQATLLELVQRELETTLQAHLQVALLRDRLLILYTDSSAWASRLRFVSRTLRGRLSERGYQIDKITVRVSLKPAERAPGQHRRSLSRENGRLLDRTADGIDDPDLRRALKRLSRHSQ
ncbi:MAG: DUF721 domain-containing protein [Gammaproteobacteria bacterium]|nr:DUF721 domain-containing protein [Gammaproteobacteria bacterium]MCP5415766.1 DUF721 domain-containing protein [Chromatiaceae bacterium]